jgi:hypothetical protein
MGGDNPNPQSNGDPDKYNQIIRDVTQDGPMDSNLPEGKNTERQDKFSRLHDRDHQPEREDQQRTGQGEE